MNDVTKRMYLNCIFENLYYLMLHEECLPKFAYFPLETFTGNLELISGHVDKMGDSSKVTASSLNQRLNKHLPQLGELSQLMIRT